ncbi:protein of unknown function [Lachnospiraceae bacterium YSD2013]|nr:protein of unknown function [Lachnospiraceae bacterium YSD2013]
MPNSKERKAVSIQDKYITEEQCKKAVLNDIDEYKSIPLKFITPKFVAEVAKATAAETISYIPKELKTKEFYVELVKYYPELIWNIPKNMHTAGVCRAAIDVMGYKSTAEAITVNPELLSQLHTSLYDYDSCLAFVNSDFFAQSLEKAKKDRHFCGFNRESDEEKGLFYINERFNNPYSLKHMLRWPDVCEKMVQLHPMVIKFAKEEALTSEVCAVAMNIDIDAFKYIHDKFKTEKVCEEAIDKRDYLINFFPERLLTYDKCFEAVRSGKMYLWNVPKKFVSKEICIEAVKVDGTTLYKVPAGILDKDICLAAVRHGIPNNNILREVPDEFKDFDVCLEAVKYSARNLEYVPKEQLNYDICYAAVLAPGLANIELIPHDYFKEELCLAMVKDNKYYLESIPKDCVTKRVSEIAAQKHN